MIWPMANSQMLTSKNPRKAARARIPRATKIVRIVDSVTTHVSAKNTTTGNAYGKAARELIERVTTGPPWHGLPAGEGASRSLPAHGPAWYELGRVPHKEGGASLQVQVGPRGGATGRSERDY